ncbi:sodium channel protein Nach [Cephus cinctus]|uniref:Sodium channel protein Nach n=1 Tax=Cephus cinctus TaxID=211228 RepID=A0AAJ7CCP3_CEPCN|nr:sodium channel protein Nach [Cephus cinctus]
MYKSKRTRYGGHTVKYQKKNWMKIWKNQAKEFCLATGIHGYKYIAQDHRSKIERILWGIVVLALLICALILMKMTWDYYSEHSTLTVLESTHYGIWNYPFPAVTVCNINRVSRSLATRFIETLNALDNNTIDIDVNDMRLLNELLDPGVFGYDVTKNLSRLQDYFDMNNFSIIEVLSKVTPRCDRLLSKCAWNSEFKDCDTMFQPARSRDGFCCSFNYVNQKSIDSTKPRNKIFRSDRVTGCGYQTGLTIMVNPEPEDYFAAIISSYGVKVMIHHPLDYPDYNAESKFVGVGLQTFLNIAPQETYSTEGVKEFSISARNCLLPNEREREEGVLPYRNLSALKPSYINCLIECRATIIREKCGCIPYYYKQNVTKVCDLKDVKCLKGNKYLYQTLWPGINVLDPTFIPDEDTTPCSCMPDCEYYVYPTESSQGVIDRSNFSPNSAFFTNSTSSNLSVIHIFFGDLVSIRYRRDAYHNWHNLFASFGGLLGLFAGFSFMSVFEFIYFFVIRVVAGVNRNRKKDNFTL